MDESTEQWRPVVGYEGRYEVSDQGRVRSLSRLVRSGPGRKRQHIGRVLSVHHGDHYAKVRLKVDGGGSTKNVHQLVAAAFFGPCPDGLEVCHNNGHSHDNRVTNLRYDTRSANNLDILAHGTHHYAHRTHCERGHEYTPENTMIRISEGQHGRRCRACETARTKARRERRAWQRKSPIEASGRVVVS